MIKWNTNYVRERMTAESSQGVLERPDAFESLELAFLGSLIPGIIHNFATPLSGVIGATQLLETRAEQIDACLESAAHGQATAVDDARAHMQRQRTNLDILSRNAQHLADLLQVLVHRINRSSVTQRDYFPLSELVAAEVRFLDSNLHFKHKVKKELQLSADLPATAFIYGHVVSAMEELACMAMLQHDASCGTMEMTFVTGFREGRIHLDIEAKLPNELTDLLALDILNLQCARLREDGWTTEILTRPCILMLMLSRAPDGRR
jgi:signal transduction histidine kinase